MSIFYIITKQKNFVFYGTQVKVNGLITVFKNRAGEKLKIFNKNIISVIEQFENGKQEFREDWNVRA